MGRVEGWAGRVAAGGQRQLRRASAPAPVTTVCAAAGAPAGSWGLVDYADRGCAVGADSGSWGRGRDE